MCVCVYTCTRQWQTAAPQRCCPLYHHQQVVQRKELQASGACLEQQRRKMEAVQGSHTPLRVTICLSVQAAAFVEWGALGDVGCAVGPVYQQDLLCLCGVDPVLMVLHAAGKAVKCSLCAAIDGGWLRG